MSVCHPQQNQYYRCVTLSPRLMSAPLFNSVFTTSLWPSRQAIHRGVKPLCISKENVISSGWLVDEDIFNSEYLI